jgi:hypothetical protein
MTERVQKNLPLTAKQRLAVSRQALVVASQETILKGVARRALQEFMRLLERPSAVSDENQSQN